MWLFPIANQHKKERVYSDWHMVTGLVLSHGHWWFYVFGGRFIQIVRGFHNFNWKTCGKGFVFIGIFFYIKKLWLISVSKDILFIFYKARIELIFQNDIVSWFGNQTIKSKSQVNPVVKFRSKIVWHTLKKFFKENHETSRHHDAGSHMFRAVSKSYWNQGDDARPNVLRQLIESSFII